MKADDATASAVREVLQSYFDALRSRDEATMLALFANDADLVLFGSGADERRVGKDEVLLQARRDWIQSESMSLLIDWSSVSSAGDVAWASTELTVSVVAEGRSMTLPARFSVVLERRSGRWLIVQSHFSFPAGDQADGSSFPRSLGPRTGFSRLLRERR